MTARRYVDNPVLSADWRPSTAGDWVRRKRESPAVGAATARMIRGLARRAADADTEAFEELLALAEVLRQSTGEAALALHSGGFSWTQIADLGGVSRQAARQRFGLPTYVAAEFDSDPEATS